MSTPPPPPLVLASASPRRTALLSMLGIAHTVDPACISEDPAPGEAPAAYVERLARDKALEVAARHPRALVLAGDTVVVREGRMLGKPADEAEAEAMLLELAGRDHEVLTGLALALPSSDAGGTGPVAGAGTGPRLLGRTDRARVHFRAFGARAARDYVATGEPMDKAGGYGIQGRGAALVSRVEGDYYTVVGLSVSGLMALLEAAGLRYTFRGLERRASPRPPSAPEEP